MSKTSLVAPLHIGLQMHRSHDSGLFPAYFEYLPPLEDLRGNATFLTFQFGKRRGINCTYPLGYRFSINVYPGDQCSITLKVEQPSPPFDTGRNHTASFLYSEQGVTDIETNGVELVVHTEPPFVTTLIEAFEAFVSLYHKVHPRIAAPWYHGADERACDLYRRDPSAVRFGWLLGSNCNARFFACEDFELEIIEHCFRASQAQKKDGEADLMFPYWYDSVRGLSLLSPSAFIAEWKALRASFQKGHLS